MTVRELSSWFVNVEQKKKTSSGRNSAVTGRWDVHDELRAFAGISAPREARQQNAIAYNKLLYNLDED